jgi:hypothetical protein
MVRILTFGNFRLQSGDSSALTPDQPVDRVGIHADLANTSPPPRFVIRPCEQVEISLEVNVAGKDPQQEAKVGAVPPITNAPWPIACEGCPPNVDE